MPRTTSTDGPPVWQQYQRFKRQHPGALLLFRMGDFYETFDADAEIVARELDVVLTAREMGKGQRHPLAGIPYHALDGHLARLVNRGYRVAICEQIGDPATSRGLVDRQVVRVVTPGTLAEPHLLEAKANNFVAAVYLEPTGAGLAHLDVSTGEFVCCQIDAMRAGRRAPEPASELARRAAEELGRIGPAEVLVPTDDPRGGVPDGLPPELRRGFHLTPYERWRFGEDVARERLRGHYGVATLDGFGCGDRPLAVRAAGALLQYVADTTPGALQTLRPLRTAEASRYMVLDPATRRNLELTAGGRGRSEGSLLGVLDRTRTAMGGRLLRHWLAFPLLERAALEERLDAVASLHGAPSVRARLAGPLAKVGDLERLAARVAQGQATPRELLAVSTGLRQLPALAEALGELGAGGACLAPVASAHVGAALAELAELVARAIVPDPPPSLAAGGVIARGYAPELDELIASTAEAREWMATLEARERERTGLRGLRVGYNRVFGYYLEVSSAALRLPPTPEIAARLDGGPPVATVQEFLERQAGYLRKQTLVGAERYITPELKEKEQLIAEAHERIVALERRLFERLCQQVAAHHAELAETAGRIAYLDVCLSLAEVAAANRYVRPRLDEGDAIEIIGGRHPVVERSALENGFVPNDTRLSTGEEQILVVTGPNMAGKSTYLRQVGLIVLMAQIGSFVPADEAMIGLVDRIFTRVGAQDDIATGQSTFMVEMAETANILHHATRRSLVIFDEIGRGTSTYDGMAIARAIVEHLHDDPRLGCKTLFATHYHELTELARALPRVRNLRVDVLEDGDSVVFLHRVVPGGADRSYGIHVARLAGIPGAVLQRARALLRELESKPRRQRLGQSDSPARGLFDGPRDPLVDELAQLDPDGLTPLQALNKLYELRDRARLTP